VTCVPAAAPRASPSQASALVSRSRSHRSRAQEASAIPRADGMSVPSRWPRPRTVGEASHSTPPSAPATGPASSAPMAYSTKATPAVSASGTSREANVTRRSVPAASCAAMNRAPYAYSSLPDHLPSAGTTGCVSSTGNTASTLASGGCSSLIVTS
jgi:hypothetical protein